MHSQTRFPGQATAALCWWLPGIYQVYIYIHLPPFTSAFQFFSLPPICRTRCLSSQGSSEPGASPVILRAFHLRGARQSMPHGIQVLTWRGTCGDGEASQNVGAEAFTPIECKTFWCVFGSWLRPRPTVSIILACLVQHLQPKTYLTVPSFPNFCWKKLQAGRCRQ